ncbi:MAG: hypothetical protein ACRDJJ_08755 [Actinomycetota bacterium]
MLKGFCDSCERVVYIEDDADRCCPVCSSSILNASSDDQPLPASP